MEGERVNRMRAGNGDKLDGRYTCDGPDSVAQWMLDDSPLYLLRYTFDGTVAGDVSGHESHPGTWYGVTAEAPVPISVDGRAAFDFDGTLALSGTASESLDLDGRVFSVFATFASRDAAGQQVLFGLEPTSHFTLGFEDGFPMLWVSGDGLTAGVEEVIATGCHAGSCLRMVHNDASWQGASQTVGTLAPGASYELSVWFDTAASHNGFVGLFDASWKDASCSVTGRNFTVTAAGSGAWQEIVLNETVPEVDDCGESTADDTWKVLLYGHDPTTDNSPVLYDDVALIDTSAPGTNLIDNPGFEQDLDDWSASHYLAPIELTGEIPIVPDEWHTIGFVYEDSTARLYLDGALQDEQLVSLADFPSAGSFAIGAQSSSTEDAFDGYLDDLFVAGMALDDAQIEEYGQDQHHTLTYPGTAACIVDSAQGTVTAEEP